MNTAEIILEELRQGERTTTQLTELTGRTRNSILCAIAGLNDRPGTTILNVTLPGGHADGRWRLTQDAERRMLRVCSVPGCRTQLNRYNATDYCLIHRHELAALALSCRAAWEVDVELAGVL